MLRNRKIGIATSLILAIVCAASFVIRARAQEAVEAANAETPEAVATRLFETNKTGDFEAYAQMLHPDALADYKKIIASFAERGATKDIVQKWLGIKSKADYEALTGVQVFSRFMSNVTRMAPGTKETMANTKAEVLGQVMEDAETAHVVTRITTVTTGLPLAKMSVITIRRDGDAWKAMLSEEIEGLRLLAVIEQSLNRHRKPTPPAKKPPTKAKPRKGS
jgi:hypothetical protein